MAEEELLTGYIPTPEDQRDDPEYTDGLPGVAFAGTAAEGDSGLWDLPNPILRQVDGSCVPNAVVQQVRHCWWTEGNPFPEMPSRSYVFYHAKAAYGIEKANGCFPRGAYLAMQDEGFPKEKFYEHTNHNNFNPPTVTAYQNAYGRTKEGIAELEKLGMTIARLKFTRITSDIADTIRQVVTAKRTVGIDLPVNEAFFNYKASDGFWKPGGPELGRHYVLLGAYNASGCWCLSSWGANFGYRGGIWVPWSVITDRSVSYDRIVIYSAPRFIA